MLTVCLNTCCVDNIKSLLDLLPLFAVSGFLEFLLHIMNLPSLSILREPSSLLHACTHPHPFHRVSQIIFPQAHLITDQQERQILAHTHDPLSKNPKRKKWLELQYPGQNTGTRLSTRVTTTSNASSPTATSPPTPTECPSSGPNSTIIAPPHPAPSTVYLNSCSDKANAHYVTTRPITANETTSSGVYTSTHEPTTTATPCSTSPPSCRSSEQTASFSVGGIIWARIRTASDSRLKGWWGR